MNNSVTFRVPDEARFNIREIERDFRVTCRSVSVGRGGMHWYLRGKPVALAPAFDADFARLPQDCEVFSFIATSESDAQTVHDGLSGRGGLGGVHSITRNGAALTLEYIGDLFLLFDFLDTIPVSLERRAVVPLEDASLIAVANTVWRDGALDEQRILERAAGRV